MWAEAFAWFLACRYLLTRGINAVALFGVAVAVWALIVVIAVFSGMIAQIHEHVRSASAELLLQDLDQPCSYAQVRRVLEADPEVESTAPRLSQVGIYFPRHAFDERGGGVVRALEQKPLDHNFLVFVGVDPVREARTTGFSGWLDAVTYPGARVADLDAPFRVPAARIERVLRLLGEDLPPGGVRDETSRALIVSTDRFSRPVPLDCGLGVDVVGGYFATRDGKPELQQFKFPLLVAGAYRTEYMAVNLTQAFVPIQTLRDALGFRRSVARPDQPFTDIVSEVAIRARPGADLARVAARLQQLVAPHFGGRVQSWMEQNATYLSAVHNERGLMKVVLFVVMLVAGFLVYAMLHMMVAQKRRDIGVLTALGATPRGVLTVFLLCGGLVGAAGCVLGTIAGALSAAYLNDVNDWMRASFGFELFPRSIYLIDRIPYQLEAEWIGQVVLGAFVLTILVAFLPARRAARLSPVQALAHE